MYVPWAAPYLTSGKLTLTLLFSTGASSAAFGSSATSGPYRATKFTPNAGNQITTFGYECDPTGNLTRDNGETAHIENDPATGQPLMLRTSGAPIAAVSTMELVTPRRS